MILRLTLTCLVSLFLLASCGGNEPIVGEWKLVEIDYSEHLKEIDPMLKDAFIDMLDQQSASLLNKTFFTFNKDSELTIVSPKYMGGTTTAEGTYEFNDSKDSLYIHNEDSESYAIAFIEDNKMKWSSGEKPYRKLTLVRN